MITRVITSHHGSLGQTDAVVFEDSVDKHTPGAALTFPSNAQEVPVTIVDPNISDDFLPVNVQDQSAMTFNPREFARNLTRASSFNLHWMELANSLLKHTQKK